MEVDTAKKDKHKAAFAEAVAEGFRQVYPEQFDELGQAEMFDPDVLYGLVEQPKDPSMGRFALPVFRFLKILRQKPPEVAAAVTEVANDALGKEAGAAVTCEAVGGYINARIDPSRLAADTVGTILSQGRGYGSSEEGRGKTELVEYSSPNIAKPFGIGHLRTTVIGNSLRRIFKKLGYTVVGINYPGDWGTQFGKMIVAYRRWGGPETLQGEAVKNLLELYVRFHEEADKDDSLNEEARLAFKELEQGEPEATRLWEEFKRISFAEFDRVYTSLGVEFDLVIGESFFNDKMEAAVKRLKKAGLTEISRGAEIVDLSD
ncbi:arginine--tRNA ligase, partial [candidate division GN15 bacterium]|nr:arginine--tRNA ligase [candidate division GN15 bacterium]